MIKIKEDLKIPGISVAVGKGGQIIWKEGIGLANIKKGEEVTPATKFRIGSISKTLTALALGKLFDEAKIDWSDSVAKYVSFQDAPEYSFSIRQLAGHQAGIRHYKGLEFFSNKQFNSVKTFKAKKPKTIKLYFGFIKAYLRKVHDVRLSTDDIKDYVQMPKDVKEQRKPISLNTLKLLFGKCDPERRALYYILISSGMRLGEALSLKKSDKK